MEPLLVRNEATGHTLRVEDHAMERWGELHGHTTDDITVSLGRAIPFGAQIGNDEVLLLDGDVAFAVKLGRAMVVRTVLPKAMAVANMQNFIGSARKAAYINVVKTPANQPRLFEQKKAAEAEEIAALHNEGQGLKKLTDEQLELRRQLVVENQRVTSGKLGKAYGRLRCAIEVEQKRRRMAGKVTLSNTDHMRIDITSVKQALREMAAEGLISPEQLQWIYQRTDAIRDQARERLRCTVSA